MTLFCYFFWVLQSSQEKLRTMLMNFFGGRGGGEGGEGGKGNQGVLWEIGKWHILALFCPFKDLGILDQLILLVLLLNRRPASGSFLSLVQFWRTRERLCLNRVRPLLGICCMRCLLLEYIFDPRPDSPCAWYSGPSYDLWLSIKGCSQLKKTV